MRPGRVALLRLSRRDLRDLLHDHPDLAVSLLLGMATRLRTIVEAPRPSRYQGRRGLRLTRLIGGRTAETIMHRHSLAAVLFVSASFLTRDALGQDANITVPVGRVDSLLRHGTIKPVAAQGSRFEGDRTEHALLSFDDSTAFEVKWATSARGGEAFNNQPRYEAAAYELQRLYLGERDLVVPPTVLRMIPGAVFATAKLRGEPTFDDTPSILVALQYWTMDVTADDVFDTKRAERDSVYARHLGDLNI